MHAERRRTIITRVGGSAASPLVVDAFERRCVHACSSYVCKVYLGQASAACDVSVGSVKANAKPRGLV